MAFRKQRMGRRKVCYFTKNNIKFIDYKDVELLKKFISPNAKITPRRVRALVLNIKDHWLLQLSVLVKWLYYHT